MPSMQLPESWSLVLPGLPSGAAGLCKNSIHLHPEYAASAGAWKRCRDVLAGENAVKAAGEAYLPRLDSQSDAKYRAYVNRANFFNATSRTAEGYLGMIFRREALVKLGDAHSPEGRDLTAFATDVDLAGTPLNGYAKRIVGEVVGLGRAGTLVDWDAREQRAYLADYCAENILNWRQERRGGRNVLTLLVLREWVPDPASDEFEGRQLEQLRVLRLAGPEGAGQVVVEVWRTDKEGQWVLVSSVKPTRRGRSLPAIPFLFHGSMTCRPGVEKMPLADLVPLNLDHYRLDADYKHGIHFTALPTAWVAGFSPEATLRIGSTTAWVSDQVGSAAGFLEFKGEGLRTFQDAQNHDEQLMAVLGARVLFNTKRVAESAEAMQLRMVSEDSILATLSIACSEGLTAALRWVAGWHSGRLEVPEAAVDVELRLNTDFDARGLTAKDLTAIVAAWQAGALTGEQMGDLLRRGEIMPMTAEVGESEDRKPRTDGQLVEG